MRPLSESTITDSKSVAVELAECFLNCAAIVYPDKLNGALSSVDPKSKL